MLSSPVMSIGMSTTAPPPPPDPGWAAASAVASQASASGSICASTATLTSQTLAATAIGTWTRTSSTRTLTRPSCRVGGPFAFGPAVAVDSAVASQAAASSWTSASTATLTSQMLAATATGTWTITSSIATFTRPSCVFWADAGTALAPNAAVATIAAMTNLHLLEIAPILPTSWLDLTSVYPATGIETTTQPALDRRLTSA